MKSHFFDEKRILLKLMEIFKKSEIVFDVFLNVLTTNISKSVVKKCGIFDCIFACFSAYFSDLPHELESNKIFKINLQEIYGSA